MRTDLFNLVDKKIVTVTISNDNGIDMTNYGTKEGEEALVRLMAEASVVFNNTENWKNTQLAILDLIHRAYLTGADDDVLVTNKTLTSELEISKSEAELLRALLTLERKKNQRAVFVQRIPRCSTEFEQPTRFKENEKI